MTHTVYTNPRAQDRHTVAKLFGHSASNRAVREWKPAAALVYDFYEMLTATDWDRAVQHVMQNPHSVIVLNFSHESMPSDIGRATEYPVMTWLHSAIDPLQLVVLCSQQDTLHSIQAALPGTGTLCINYWETHVLHKQPRDFSSWLTRNSSTHRLGSLNRRYTASRAAFLYHIRDLLPNMLYSFGDRGFWTDTPAGVFQEQELRHLRRWDNSLAMAVQQWQAQQRPWRLLGNSTVDNWDSELIYHSTAGADHWAVIESRAHSTRSSSGFFTEKTFRVIAAQRAVYPITEGDTDATLRSWGYEPYWQTPVDKPLVKIQALADHWRSLAGMDPAQYLRHQQAQQALIQHNSQTLALRTSTAYRRQQAPKRLQPYFR